MTTIQFINTASFSYSITTLLPNAVPELPDSDIETSHSTAATLLPDADELPDAAPALPDATAIHSTATVSLHDANLLLLARLTANLQEMSSHYIVEDHRIECPEYVVEILKKEANIEFIKGVSTVATKYIELLKTIATPEEWCLVGTEWRNLKEKINIITSNSRNPNKNRPLWKLPSAMHAYILSYLSNEDVLRVSFIAKGFLPTMVHQDESLWQQRALYQLGGELATATYTKYLHVPKPWKKICLTLTYKGIESPRQLEVGSFKDGQLNGPGKRFTLDKKERISTNSSLLHRPGKIIHEAFEKEDIVEEGTFVNGILTSGTITYLHRYKEEGTFKYRKLCGQGRKIYFSGLIRIEEGLFEDSKLNGEGKRIWDSRQVDQGLFRNDRFISGKRTDSHGNTEEGTFEFDRLYRGIRKKKLANGIILEEEGIFHTQGLHGKGKRILTQRIEGSKFKTEKKTDSQRNTEEGIFLFGELIQGTKTFAAGSVVHIDIEEGSFENKHLHDKRSKKILRTRKIKEGDFKHEESIHSTSTSFSFSSFFKGCFTSG